MMQAKKYIQQFYRALVILSMVYAVTLIADTAAADTLNAALSVVHR